MTKKKSSDPASPQAQRETREAEARGESDFIQLTNDSGEVKKLTPEEWEIQKEMLLSDGWKVLGGDKK